MSFLLCRKGIIVFLGYCAIYLTVGYSATYLSIYACFLLFFKFDVTGCRRDILILLIPLESDIESEGFYASWA
jgi:hypothetical protein